MEAMGKRGGADSTTPRLQHCTAEHAGLHGSSNAGGGNPKVAVSVANLRGAIPPSFGSPHQYSALGLKPVTSRFALAICYTHAFAPHTPGQLLHVGMASFRGQQRHRLHETRPPARPDAPPLLVAHRLRVGQHHV